MAIVLDIDMEGNDWNEFDATSLNGGDMFIGSGLAGTTYGIHCLIDDVTDQYAYEAFACPTTLRFRIYFDPNTFTTTTWYATIVKLSQVGSPYNSVATLAFTPTASGYAVTLKVQDDANSDVFSDVSSIFTDAPHYIEIKLVSAATVDSNDGQCEWWLDGVSQGSANNLDNYNNHHSSANLYFYTGAQYKGGTGSGTFIIDQIILNNDGGEIGPMETEISGSVCWGHDTGVTETNVRDFSGNWTGTGAISGAADAETIDLNSGEYMISEVVNTGVRVVELEQNHYDETGDDVNMDYRHGADAAACEAASWNDYSAPFQSLGYVQVRLTSTL